MASTVSFTARATQSSTEIKTEQCDEWYSTTANPVYDEIEEEPQLHIRTYVAIAALLMLNLVQLFALQGPPSFLSNIGLSLNATQTVTWVPNALALVQAVLGPIMSFTSDTFQARKLVLAGSCVVSFVGSAIAPKASTIGQLIAAQTLIGVGFAAAPVSYCVVSEILPRRWRPLAQAATNVGAGLGALLAPVVMGAFTQKDALNGWRNFYWVEMALWGVSGIGIFLGYRPPKRHTRYDHLSLWQKIGRLDLIGSALLAIGLAMFLAGLTLGGGLYTWTNARVLVTIVLGGVALIAFGVYETYGTKTGILHHDLFQGETPNAGRTVVVCAFLIFVEACLAFAYLIFYPTLTTALFERRSLLLAAREEAFWIVGCIACVFWGYVSTKFRTIRLPMAAGYLVFTAATVGMATIQPGDSINSIAFACLAGFGFGAALVLVVSGAQLCTPHHLIATVTALIFSVRAISASAFTAIFAAAFRTRINDKLPAYVAAAALKAGLPPASVTMFVTSIATGDMAALSEISGVTPAIISAGLTSLKQAMADSLRVVYIIAAPIGVLGVIAAFLLGNVAPTMNYRVDAPMEELKAKHHHGGSQEQASLDLSAQRAKRKTYCVWTSIRKGGFT